jgi:hypothetical protein
MKLKNLNLITHEYHDIGTQNYDGVVHFKNKDVYYGYMNRTIYRNFGGIESNQHVATWSPGWYKTIEKSLNDRDLIVSINRNEIMIFFDVAEDEYKNLDQLPS